MLADVSERLCKSSVNHLVVDDFPPVIYGVSAASCGKSFRIRAHAQDRGGPHVHTQTKELPCVKTSG